VRAEEIPAEKMSKELECVCPEINSREDPERREGGEEGKQQEENQVQRRAIHINQGVGGREV